MSTSQASLLHFHPCITITLRKHAHITADQYGCRDVQELWHAAPGRRLAQGGGLRRAGASDTMEEEGVLEALPLYNETKA
jgi:hypothetical protein